MRSQGWRDKVWFLERLLSVMRLLQKFSSLPCFPPDSYDDFLNCHGEQNHRTKETTSVGEWNLREQCEGSTTQNAPEYHM